MTEQEEYFEGHRNCGIKVGDRVRVTRKAESEEGGWDNSWEEEMDKFVWTKGIVRADVYELGFSVYVDELQDYFAFPYFVLEKI